MHGYEKTPEEIEKWRPQATNIDSQPVTHKKTSTSSDKSQGFADPWNCDACRRRDKLCPLHQSMTDDGKQPPKQIKGRQYGLD